MTPDRPALVSTSGFTLVELAALFTRGFAGYLVPVHVSPEALATRIRVEHVDLEASRVVVDAQGAALALALIARRGRECRLAAFGIVEAARGQGLGTRAMTGLIEEARTRGDRRMLLEVFEANRAGVALYERLGFVTQRPLIGWEGALPPVEDPALREVEPGALGHAIARHREPDAPPLPWQVRAEGFVGMTAPYRAFALDDAIATVVTRGPALHLSGLFTRPGARRRGQAARLVRAIVAHLGPDRVIVPPIVPEEIARDWCAAVGLVPSALAQREMALAL
ncbi:MAG: GNAT family N-acetyltransferase [Deltaproteobacteria bacterium]|nr:GNAT family N-acetyltransferase [Deltaproteobacteria bacterium]